jgi:hypothetical protein
MMREELRRAENILSNGRTRASHVAKVMALRDGVESLGKGPMEDLFVGSSKEGVSELLERIAAPPIQRDNTSVRNSTEPR